jgi:hypothetical protein
MRQQDSVTRTGRKTEKNRAASSSFFPSFYMLSYKNRERYRDLCFCIPL